MGLDILEWCICKSLTNTFSVVDADMDSGESKSVIIDETQLIRMPQSLNILKLDVSTYMLPVGYKVLALWPSSTTYYEAVVDFRENVPVRVKRRTDWEDDEILIHFEEGQERFSLSYASVIPRRNTW